MTDWKKVQGSQKTQPETFDTTSSAVVVYQHRNIERVTVENTDGTTTELWQYDEREMSKEEYTLLALEQLRADTDYIMVMEDLA